jgi:hypothetical protein
MNLIQKIWSFKLFNTRQESAPQPASNSSVAEIPTFAEPLTIQPSILPKKEKQMSIFTDIEGFFAKFFKTVPKWNTVALSTLGVVTPLLEDVLAFADPSAEKDVAPILAEIQTDLGTISATLNAGSTTNLASLIASVKTNLPALLAAAKISNPTSVERATALVNTISAELSLIVAAIPASA